MRDLMGKVQNFLELLTRSWMWLAILIALMLIWGGYLYRWDLHYNSDVAMIGLMGKRIADGLETPIFVWTVGYQGVFLAAYLAAGLFKIFGISPFVLSLAPAFYCTLFLVALFYAVRRCFNRPTAMLTVFLVVVSCPQFYSQFLRTLPNYPEIHLGGMLGLLIYMSMVSLLTQSTRNDIQIKLLGLAGLLGLVHGFFYYTFALSLLFSISVLGQLLLVLVGLSVLKSPAGIKFLLPYKNFRSPYSRGFGAFLFAGVWIVFFGALAAFFGWIQPKVFNASTELFIAMASLIGFYVFALSISFSKRILSFKILICYAVGGLIGYSPALYFRYVLQGVSLRSPTIDASWSAFVQRFRFFLEFHERLFNFTGSVFFDSLIALVVTASVIFFIVHTIGVQWRQICGKVTANEKSSGQGFFLLLPIMISGAFLSSSLVQDLEHGRWIITLTVFYALAVGYTVTTLWQRKMGSYSQLLLALGLAAIVTNNGRALYRDLTSENVQEEKLKSITDAFDRHHLTRGYGNYWLSYIVNLKTAEQIIVQPFDVPYSPYYGALVAGQDSLGFVSYRGSPRNPVEGKITLDGHEYRVVNEELLDPDLQFFALSRITKEDQNKTAM